jgi:hypothetical protein
MSSLMHAWRARVLVGLGVVTIVAIGAIAFVQLAGQQFVAGLSKTQTSPCSPQPCLNVHNYLLWVSDVSEADSIVRMQVRFRNSSESTHAAPEDLELIDANHQSSPAIQGAAGCTHWTRTEFNNGASLGPITLCFRPASMDPPLSLRWSPDFGLLCCQADVRIK